MKILIAQTNTTPNDFDGNFEQIKRAIDKGWGAVDLVVTPELSIPGYLVKDLMYDDSFIEKNLETLQKVVEATKNQRIPSPGMIELRNSDATNGGPVRSFNDIKTKTYVIVGYIDKNRTGKGKPFRNMLAVICDGAIVATYQKRLLPFYDVFDEGRYFEPGTEGTVIEIAGKKWGLAICEDIFNDKGMDDYNYATNPLAEYRNIGVNNIISINSSPFRKPKERANMVRESFKNGTIIYCNQTGGQDDLVFDGHSMIVQNEKVLLFADAETPLLNFDFDNGPENDVVKMAEITRGGNGERRIASLFQMLVIGLRDYIHKNGFKTAVFGSSGGIDSALVAALLCEAIGPKNVYGIRMPSVISSSHSVDDALALQQNLGFNDFIVPIEHKDNLKKYNEIFSPTMLVGTPDWSTPVYNSVADENIQARIRGMIIMHFSNAFGAIPIATGNKSELSVGYCTLYGDMCGGFAPLSDVYKMDVYALAEYYNEKVKADSAIPLSIIEKAPSAELSEGQEDSDSLLPYPILDMVLFGLVEHHISNFDVFCDVYEDIVFEAYGFSKSIIPEKIKSICFIKDWIGSKEAKQEYDKTIQMVKRNEFKRRQAAPGIKVSKVAFGSGRRMPITKK